MGFLFGEPKIEGDELRKCLAYLEEEGKLVIFRGKEEDLYNNTLVKYSKSVSTDSHAAKEMCRAAGRLVQAASEIIKRRGEMTIHTRCSFFYVFCMAEVILGLLRACQSRIRSMGSGG